MLGAGFFAAVLIAAGALGNVQSASAATSGVSIKNFHFTPDTISIKTGETVRWINDETSVPHTVTSETAGGFASVPLKPGDSYFQTFTQAGAYNYYCTIHPTMRGVILVGGATGAPSKPPAAAPVATPKAPSTGSGFVGGSDSGTPASWAVILGVVGVVLAASGAASATHVLRRR